MLNEYTTENSDEEKTQKNGGEVDLPPEYGGLSREFTAETGEPAPLAEENSPPLFKTYNTPEEVKIPKEAENYDTAEKLRWLVLILFLAAPFVAAVVLLFFGKTVPAMICIGCFVIILPAFFVIYLTKERSALIGKGIVGKPDTRQIEAEVISCVCVTRRYHEHNIRGVGVKRELVDVTYKTVITDGRNNYTAKTKIYYGARESVNAYVRKNRAFIDPTDEQNKRALMEINE